jgi:hypothetical protein
MTMHAELERRVRPDPDRLAGALHEGPVPAGLGDAELRRARAESIAAAWAALRADDPGGLGAIAASRSPELRFLGEAFDRLSREYPSTRDGLSLTERRILAATPEEGASAGAVFARLGEREARPTTWPSTPSTAGSAGSTCAERTPAGGGTRGPSRSH